MVPITRDNHYVPRFYLKNWSDDGKTIFVYQTLVSDESVDMWQKKSISKIGSYQDLYTVQCDGEDNDDIEKWLNEDFETPVCKVIEKIKRDEKINIEERNCLLRFMASQYVRTPASIFRHFTRMENVFSSTTKNMSINISADKIKSYNSVDHTSPKPWTSEIPLSCKVDRDRGEIEFRILPGKSSYLCEVKHLLTETYKVLLKQRWHIVKAPNGIEWPTSDDPVICLNYYGPDNYDFGGGWGRKNSEIIFPLSRKYLLYTQIGNFRKTCDLHMSEKYSLFVRNLIVEHAHRYVFAPERIKGMLLLHHRVVNRELFIQEKIFWEKWHEDQVRNEKEFWAEDQE